MAQLGVNIDHVATLRQARRTYEPDPVWAAAWRTRRGRRHHRSPPRGSSAHQRPRRANPSPNRHGEAKLGNGLRAGILEIACESSRTRLRWCPNAGKKSPPRAAGHLPQPRPRKKNHRAVPRGRHIRSACFSIPTHGRSKRPPGCHVAAVELHTGQYALAPRRRSSKRELENLRPARWSVRPAWPCTPGTA
jgi:pyridoxine 5-phosphate synthase